MVIVPGIGAHNIIIMKRHLLLLLLLLSASLTYGDTHVVHQWREENVGGIFSIYTQYSNGTTQQTIYNKCSICLGIGKCRQCGYSGRCNMCGGRGMRFWPYTGWQPCSMCSGSGRCMLCKGSGKCICSDDEYPGYQIGAIIIKDANGKITNSVSATSFGSEDRVKIDVTPSEPSKASCSSCGGTGIDRTDLKYWAGTVSFLGHYHKGGYPCRYCDKTYEHYHSKCTTCNVPRH